MNDYLLKAREALGLNKIQMSEMLGITNTYYAMMEKGVRTLQPVYIKTLEEKAGIRRAWLERGELPMFRSEEQDETLKEFRKLTDAQKQLVLDMIKQFNDLNESKI